MPWAAAAAAVVGIAGAASQADSARSAANAQSDAAKKGAGEMRREFDISQANAAPWLAAGKTALGDLSTGLGQVRSGVDMFGNDPRYKEIYQQLYNQVDADHRASQGGRPLEAAASIDPDAYKRTMQIIQDAAVREFSAKYPEAAAATNQTDPNFGSLTRKFTMEDFQNDPVTKASFDFGMSEGEKAVQRMFGSRGLSRSGAAVKAATRFATDYTGTKAGESRDRYVQDQTNLYNRYAGVSGTGQVTATNNATNAMNLGTNIGNLLVGEGNARGAATIAQGNAWGGAASNAGNSLQNAYWLNRVFPEKTTTQPTSTYGDVQV